MEEEKQQEPEQKIVQKLIEEEMKQSYLDYSMSIIVGRALPDVRDGLKPVHRRILYAMQQMGMFHNKPFKKSARIVGEVLGKFHPHGDTAVYDSLVRLTQPFSMRYPLIQGQGNFGSIDGDNAAAMRYTEARLNKLAEEMLQDIEKKTVKFVPNFDGSLKEPTALPSKVPNLLVNGSSGIAVGMATNIPPHNMAEVIDATIAQINNPEITIKELMQYVQGPDFPTGALICGRHGIVNAYNTGRGKITIRAKITREERRIIITEIPYMVNKSLAIEEIADQVRDKRIEGISDIRDESDREGMRIVIELRKDANQDVVLNQLYKHSKLQTTFGVIMLALVDNQPRVLNLKGLIQNYVDYRKLIVKRRTQFELQEAQDKAHILEGLIVAINNIDPVVKLIKESREVAQARSALMTNYSISEKQANAILDMKLQKLASMEQEKIKTEHADLLKLIEELKSVLASEQRILDIIKNELLELKEKYSGARRTQIIDVETTELNMEDLIKKENMVVTITHSGYIKRIPIKAYKQQHRGGKGVIAATTKDEDFVEDIFIANTHSYVLFFTDKGQVHWKKVYYIPEGSRQAKGKAIVNLLNLDKDEKVTAFILVEEFDPQKYLLMVTKNGLVKKTNLAEFSRPRRGGIRALELQQNDRLIGVKLTDGSKQIIIATKNGMAVKFNEKDIRSMGRTAKGVRGIRLREDEVIGTVIGNDEKTLLTITENGYGKRTKISEYRLISRGGSGVRNIICSERNGKVISIKSVSDEDDIMLISKQGIAIRTNARGISVIGRNTQGVRLMRIAPEDKVMAAAKIAKED
ncbi:DNA gyrase subunit A [Candidatus Woesearchaeota archaeon]|nr:DNA gyrase subunit A [Candidatus Woesearchaeota archaeon]